MNYITTHILDTTNGRPARNVDVSLFQMMDNIWKLVWSDKTNEDGRLTVNSSAQSNSHDLVSGTYRLHFATGQWFEAQQRDVFYPWIDVVFSMTSSRSHYHIPVLLSTYGYTTYRGS